MGIYDNFYCEYPLPEDFYNILTGNEKMLKHPFNLEMYQTKSMDVLGGTLSTYKLKENGSLYALMDSQYVKSAFSGLITFYTSIDDEVERVEKDLKKNSDIVDRFDGYKISSWWWIEFNALIDRGTCSWIEVQEVKKHQAEKGQELMRYYIQEEVENERT